MTLQIVQGSTSYDIQAGGTGIYLVDWVPAIAEQDETGNWPASVYEVLSVDVPASSHNDLAGHLQKLHTILTKAQDFDGSPVDISPVYLQDQLANESGLRQALIRRGSVRPDQGWHKPPVSPGNFLPSATLAIERTPFWEHTAIANTAAFDIHTIGGTWDYGATENILGDVPARIEKFEWDSNTGSGTIYEIWTGFRSNRFGNRDNFVPQWQCKDGTPGTDTSLVADAETYSTNTAAQCTFATNTAMVGRSGITLEDVTSNYADQRGRYKVLCRARTTGSRTYRLRMIEGFESSTEWATHWRFMVNTSSYKFYPAGEIQIPPQRFMRGSADSLTLLRKHHLKIEAEVAVDGTGNLNMDLLLLVPIAEGHCYVKGAQIISTSLGISPTLLYHEPNGERNCVAWKYSAGGTRPGATPLFDADDWYMPTGSGTLVVAAQQDGVSDKDDRITMALGYYERWVTLRGSE
ncbi:MAG: hypothetical protein ACYTAO_12585 [Planctomycetota bacterium]|jgi:hypothetical protein